MSNKRFLILFFLILSALTGFSLLYLLLGDKNFPLSALTENPVILQLRLPRLIGLYLVAILLSVSGFLVQIMTRNPIAELSTLGISGGASLGLALLLDFGLSTGGGISMLVAALGAFVSLFIVMILTARTHFQPLKIILVGTSVGLFATSLASSITFAKHDSQAYFLWIVGSFSGITALKNEMLLAVLIVFVLALLIFARHIRLLSLGDDLARSLGVSVNKIRLLIMILVALAAGVTVSAVGVISFVGLIAPHIAKKLTRQNFWQNLILSALTGMILLVLADFLARNLFKPFEFPAGSLTMLIGGPFFLWIIAKEAK